MNKIIRKTLLSVICLLTSLISLAAFCLMSGCDESLNQQGSGSNGSTVKANISFSVTEKLMVVGNEEYVLPEYKKLEGYTLSFASSNPTIVGVNNEGKLSALGEGSAVVTATYSNGKDSASASVNVITSFGGYLPELKTMGVEGDISIAVNTSYKVLPYVAFNGKQFSDITVNYTILDGELVYKR